MAGGGGAKRTAPLSRSRDGMPRPSASSSLAWTRALSPSLSTTASDTRRARTAHSASVLGRTPHTGSDAARPADVATVTLTDAPDAPTTDPNGMKRPVAFVEISAADESSESCESDSLSFEYETRARALRPHLFGHSNSGGETALRAVLILGAPTFTGTLARDNAEGVPETPSLPVGKSRWDSFAI
eukprot:scaffold5012_cov25-Tisochrysis_lutea.AAC.3